MSCGGSYKSLCMVKIHRTNGDLVLKDNIVSVGEDDKVLEMDGSHGCTT